MDRSPGGKALPARLTKARLCNACTLRRNCQPNRRSLAESPAVQLAPAILLGHSCPVSRADMICS